MVTVHISALLLEDSDAYTILIKQLIMKTFSDLLNDAAKKGNVLKELTPLDQKKLKTALLEEYKVIASFCERHGLVVFLGGGSCLGAVRHKGFIPWDDDLDLNMPRADYDKLIALIEQGRFPEGYEFSFPSKMHDCKNPFLKIYVEGTKNIEIYDIGTSFPKGINIDIFPMENVPNKKLIRFIKALFFEVINVITISVFYYENRNSKLEEFINADEDLRKMYLTRCLLGRLFSWIGHKTLAYWTDKIAQHDKETGLVTYPTGRRHYIGEIMPRSVFLPVSKGVFEGIEVNLPGQPEKYLENLYGKTYMQVPPPEKRERHFVVEFKI